MLSHFSNEKYGNFLQYIGRHSLILRDPRMNFAYVVQLFLLYKMVKKSLRKTLEWCRKMPYNVDQVDSIYEEKLL